MSFLTGAARFNGAPATYALVVKDTGFERLIKVGPLHMWEAFDGREYLQSNFGSPVYRRPAPFSLAEAKQWFAIWSDVVRANSLKAADGRAISGTLGNTTLSFDGAWLRATTEAVNVTEFGPFSPDAESTVDDAPISLCPEQPARIEFSLPFDLTMRVPRAPITVGERQVQVMIDTGADHSIFDPTLAEEIFEPKIKVGGAGGTMDFMIGRVRGLEFGGARIREIYPFLTPFRDMPGPIRMLRGIIGQDILARSVITFDQKRLLLTGTPVDPEPLPLPLDGPYTTAVLNGEEGWYRLDTGSEFTVHTFAREWSDQSASRARSHQGIGGATAVKPVKIGSLVLGEATFENIQGFEQPGGEEPGVIQGNIGNAILKHLKLVLDLAEGAARFERR